MTIYMKLYNNKNNNKGYKKNKYWTNNIYSKKNEKI